MEFVFFFYGLAFFLMGFAVLSYPKKGSSFYLARKIHWVGWFGILHGINEWLDMFIMIKAMELTVYLEMFRAITLPVSFICLVYFGNAVISGQNSKCRICKFITPGLVLLWAVVFLAGEHSGLRWDIWSRYLLCFSGAILTGIALWLHVPEVETSKNFKLAFNLKAAGSAFIAYAILAGLIVHDADFFPASQLNYSLFSVKLGIPVQVFRSLCSVAIACHLIYVLKLFKWETQQAMFNLEYRFQKVVQTAPVILFITDASQNITFIKGKGLEALEMTSDEVIGRPLDEVFSSIPGVHESSQRALAGKEITTTVSVGQAYYEVFLGPFRDDRKTIQGVTGVAVDVTAQKAAQASMDKYRYEMEKNKAMAAVGAMGAEIAQNTMEPLHQSKISLLRALNGLKNTIGSEAVTTDIGKGVEGLTDAIGKLGQLCEKANLKKPVAAEPVLISEIVGRILAVFQDSIQRTMLKISLHGSHILPVMTISTREMEQMLYSMMQSLIQSADGIHLTQLDIDFSIQNKFFCARFDQYRANGLTGITKESKQQVVFPEKEQYNFEFSVLRGIVDAYGGTVTVSPNSQGGFLHEIRIPVAD